ncbi:MAG TPA: hypothetical protein VK673_14370 [Chthoniobacterales bacterium]|nr:hypothetical protein [Chthoniobacterales bacterium]
MKEELETSNPVSQFIDLRPEDFDGHTEFASLSPEQRLIWLSQTARFIFVARTSREANASSRQ